jgi:hypothetical protein
MDFPQLRQRLSARVTATPCGKVYAHYFAANGCIFSNLILGFGRRDRLLILTNGSCQYQKNKDQKVNSLARCPHLASA